MDTCSRCGAVFAAGPQCPCGLVPSDSDDERDAGRDAGRDDERDAERDGVAVAAAIAAAMDRPSDDKALCAAALALYRYKRDNPSDADVHLLETGYRLAKRARVLPT